jgi:segregation and condensation protein B
VSPEHEQPDAGGPATDPGGEPEVAAVEFPDGTAAEETSVSGETPVPEETPVSAETPAPDEASVSEEAPAREEAPVPGETPVPVESTVDDADERRFRRGATPSPGPVPDEELRSAVEAILLVVDTPVAEITLAQVLERPTAGVRTALEELAADYTAQSRGMDLRRVAGGWRLYTRNEYAPYVERFVLDGQSARLTQAALETLAVVAYRQPVTRARISAIRGVGVDGVIRTLVTRGLIEECGAENESGAHLYRTTTLFLEKLGLDSLEELPALAPLLPEIEALDDVIGSA